MENLEQLQCIPGFSMLKIARLDDSFLVFFYCKQAQQKVNHCSKRERKGERGKAKEKILKIEKPKDVGHFLRILISAHARAKMS